MIFIILGLVLVFSAHPIFWVSEQLRIYQPARSDKSICTLDIYTPADRIPRLVYSMIGNSGNELVEVIPVRDTKMRITGEVIEWPKWLAPLGLGTYIKLTEVEFVHAGEYGEIITTSSAPVHRGSMPVFRRLTGWPRKFALADTRTIQTSVLPVGTNLSYTVYWKNGQLTLQ